MHLPPSRPHGRLGPESDFPHAVNTPLLILLGVALLIAAAILVPLMGGRRRRAMKQLLDAADALEARLRTARAEIEAVVGDDIDDPVRDALREMLRQRLWLREHGQGATLAELTHVRSSIDAARARIDLQLSRIERARAPLART